MAYGPRSARTSPLPPEWKPEIRPRILNRDGHACQWWVGATGAKCGALATDVDHIGDPSDHSDGNLRALCGPHHRVRSARQGAQAMHAKKIPRTRPAERHPGLL